MKIKAQRNDRKKLPQGFTLVEMLLVITIIGILAALVVPKMMGRSEQARDAAARADIASIKTALDAYEIDNGNYPRNIGELLQQPGNAVRSARPLSRQDSPRPVGAEL